jgi:hypothetical protein
MRPISALAALLALGCGLAVAQDAAHPDAHAAAAPSAGLTREKAPHGARVFIVSPKDGATVGREVHVTFGAEGIAIKPAGDTTPNSGHHHLLIDAKELPPLDAPIPNDATHKHYGKGQTEDTIQLEPGTHTLQLDLGDARHVQFDPPIVSKKITIHVK